MTVADLKAEIVATGYDGAEDMTDQMIVEVAKVLGYETPRDPKAEIITHTTGGGKTGTYIKTPGIEYQATKSDGKVFKTTSQGTFIPVEVAERIIEDLQFGVKLAKEQGLIKY